MTLSRDPDKIREWQRRSARRYEDRLREEGHKFSALKRTPIRPRNDKRRDREWTRAYGSEERVQWVQSLPSVASGETPSVNAHVRTGGTGRKADARWIVPLTWDEHEKLHRVGVKSFEATYGIDLESEARRIDKMWRQREEAI